MFTLIWGDHPIWPIFFRWVESNDQLGPFSPHGKMKNVSFFKPLETWVFWALRLKVVGFGVAATKLQGEIQITWTWPSWPVGWLITLLQTDIVVENQSFWWYLPEKMGIFDGYVSLPEGHCSITFFVVVSFLFVVSSIKSNSKYPDWNAT